MLHPLGSDTVLLEFVDAEMWRMIRDSAWGRAISYEWSTFLFVVTGGRRPYWCVRMALSGPPYPTNTWDEGIKSSARRTVRRLLAGVGTGRAWTTKTHLEIVFKKWLTASERESLETATAGATR